MQFSNILTIVFVLESSILTSLFLPLALFIIMIGMGLSLTIKDFARILHYPQAVAIGLFAQMVILPTLGLVIVTVLKLPAPFAVGLILLSVCPGGALSNLITHVAKGDAALSVTLTAFSSFISVLTIPIIISAALFHFMDTTDDFQLPFLATVGKIFAITILPISIGMIIKIYADSFAIRTEKTIRKLSVYFYILIIALIVYENYEIILPGLRKVGSAVCLLNISALLIGFGIARSLRFSLKQSIAISVETGIQNCALAVVIASTILQQADIALVPAIYSLPMFASGGWLMYHFGNREINIHFNNYTTINE